MFHDLYWLCVNGKAYILDGLQSTVTDRQKPYSTRQYAAFLRLNLPASAMWVPAAAGLLLAQAVILDLADGSAGAPTPS